MSRFDVHVTLIEAEHAGSRSRPARADRDEGRAGGLDEIQWRKGAAEFLGPDDAQQTRASDSLKTDLMVVDAERRDQLEGFVAWIEHGLVDRPTSESAHRRERIPVGDEPKLDLLAILSSQDLGSKATGHARALSNAGGM
jgi:hypothetical protein